MTASFLSMLLGFCSYRSSRPCSCASFHYEFKILSFYVSSSPSSVATMASSYFCSSISSCNNERPLLSLLVSILDRQEEDFSYLDDSESLLALPALIYSAYSSFLTYFYLRNCTMIRHRRQQTHPIVIAASKTPTMTETGMMYDTVNLFISFD